MPRRTALYLRYSDPKQAKNGGVSNASQLKDLRAAAAASGDIIVAELEDQARSGTEMEHRPAYQELLRLAKTGLIDTVRIESVSRQGRNELDRRLVERDLRAWGVEVIYLGEREDVPEHERLVYRGIQGVLSEDESVKISHRVYKRTRFRAEQGKWRGGKIPFGLKPNDAGWFDPDPDTYPFLIWMLERRAEGWGHLRIAGALNKGVSLDGAPPVKPDCPDTIEYKRRPYLERIDKETGDLLLEPKPEPRNLWGANTVRNICIRAVDGVYAGVFRWGETYEKWAKDDIGRPKTPVRFEHPPLVDTTLCQQVSAVEQHAKGRKAGGKPSAAFLLKPVCGVCGGPMHTTSLDRAYKDARYKYRYYYCSRSHNWGMSDTCRMQSLDADHIEREVLAAVAAVWGGKTTEDIQSELNGAQQRIQAEFVEGIMLLRREVEEAIQLRDDLLDKFSNLGDVSAALQRAAIDRADRAAKKVEHLENELKATEFGFRQFCARATAVQTDLEAMNLDRWETDEERMALKRVLAILVESVTLYPPEVEPIPGRGRRLAQVVTKVRGAEEVLGS